MKYCGRLAKGGKQFDKGTIDFRLGAGDVIKGWDEGVKGMMKGEKRKLFIPSAMAYGRRGDLQAHHISLKYSNLGITPVKITEILRNSEKNRRKFDEKLRNLPSPLKMN